MRPQHKVMWKANLTSCMVVFWLASLAMPLAAQQLPATPDAVRKELTQSAPTKPAEGAKPAPAQTVPAQAPKQAQTPKPALPASSAKPAAKPASASAPTLAGTAPSNATAKPSAGAAAKPSTGAAASDKTVGNSAAKPASGAIAGSKVAAGTASSVRKPAGLGGKSSGASPSAAAKVPKSKSTTSAKSDVPNATGSAVLRPVAVRENIARRDPFSPLIGRETTGGGGLSSQNLPPGKPGLLISSLRIDGIVSGPNGMIAIVSNAQDRVYFLREGDRLYDGQVQHITMDGISFHQTGKDPFGNAVEREVAKRLNSTPGEQQ